MVGQSVYEQKSSRVDQTAFRRPGIRGRSWLLACAVGLIAGGALLAAGSRGQKTIYECGPLSDAHRLFANDCAACHEAWQGPWQRLVSLDFSSKVRSVSDSKCKVCHSGAAHHPRQPAAHDILSCADCHREHRGRAELAEVRDRACLACHRDLEQHGSDIVFSSHITGLDRDSGHPEFALHRAADTAGSTLPFGTGRTRKLAVELRHAGDDNLLRARGVAEEGERDAPGDQRQWRDPGRIRFNHARHLGPAGVKTLDGRTVVLTDNCQRCHTPTADGRFMQPIHYETHCRECHPLDPHDRYGHAERFQLPHEEPEIVLGFLIHALSQSAGDKSRESDDAAERPRRSFPDLLYSPELTEMDAEELSRQLSTADDYIQRHVHWLFGAEAKGGCRYCHDVETRPPAASQPADGGDTRQLDARIAARWKIVPPAIPRRWLHHGEFDHSRHRAVSCRECHRARTASGAVVPVEESRNTSDILIPGIENCRQCHSRDGQDNAGRLQPLATSCTDCHLYHNREAGSQFRGQLDTQFKPSETFSR